ncbi:DinB family protein [Cellulomonas sp. PhB143]|uniref:DinB family protein n=1 Tax=Cellulomonas sp. PhB143 TaxID=2485186 RepID=UPI001F3EFAA3|nr:DinB family protein [Cellulomonas sp. PhB143]
MSEIEPDTKDWTWVVERVCPECGFDAGALAPDAVGAAVHAAIPRFVAVLDRDDVRERPDPSTWSPLEYAAHVRDVFDVFDGRLALMLGQEAPDFADWDQDAAAGGYAQEDSQDVAAGLQRAGARVAARFDAVEADQWERTGRRSNGSQFTVATLGQYFVHDVVHHLHDVGAD